MGVAHGHSCVQFFCVESEGIHMDQSLVLDLFKEGFFLVVVMVSVLVLPSLVVGLVVSTFQAATQINEQTLSFLPRLLATLITIMIAGPWLITSITDLMRRLMMQIPQLIG